MDDEPYGYNSIEEYYEHRPSTTMPPSEHLLSPVNYQAFSGRIPMFGSSDHVFYVSSQVSDDASAVAEIRGSNLEEEEVSTVIRAKIASHPLYSKLLEAFIDCQKVGAPPEIANLFGEICRENDQCRRSTSVSTCLGSDPELDEFMETYCDILVKYKSDLAKSFNEATTFFNGIEKQLGNLCNGASRSYVSDEAAGSSGDEFCEGGARVQESNQRGVGRELKDKLGVDRELKDKLFHKYSSYISSLKHEFSKKKKKGKLPREARQMLLEWWTIHYKWPYPTEADKVAMAESTGLDQKQINNWFINQRKRHWKPSEDMQIAVMDSLYGPFYSND